MLIQKIKKFVSQEEAATTVEYAILLVLIVLVLSQAAAVLGTTARDTFSSTASALPF